MNHVKLDSDLVISSMGGPSHEVIVLADALSNQAGANRKILDLACGDGRNGFMLSGRGNTVTAVDTSRRQMDQLQSLADHYRLPVTPVVADVRAYEFDKNYSVILAHGLIHFLTRQEIHTLIGRIQDSTVEGGINIFTTSFFESNETVIEDFRKAGHRNALKAGQLVDWYAGWETISHETYIKWDFHPGAGFHCHPIEKFIFRKPGKNPIGIKSREVALGAAKDEEILPRLLGRHIIGKKIDLAAELLGPPDNTFKYTADGPQFSFKTFDTQKYSLELSFYKNVMIYNANGLVAGISLFRSNFFSLTVG